MQLIVLLSLTLAVNFQCTQAICSANQCESNDGTCYDLGEKVSRFCTCSPRSDGPFIACTGLVLPEECEQNQCESRDGTCYDLGEKVSRFCTCSPRSDGPFIACTGLVLPEECEQNQCESGGSCFNVGEKVSKFCSCAQGSNGPFVACTGLLPVLPARCLRNQCRDVDGACVNDGEQMSDPRCTCRMTPQGPIPACLRV